MSWYRFRNLSCVVFVLALMCGLPTASLGQTEAILRMMKSGRVPAARQGNYVKVLCTRGDAEALGFVLEQAGSGAFEGEVLETAALGLAEAAEARNIIPAADPALVAKLLESDDATVQNAALKLAEAWGAEELAGGLMQLAGREDASGRTRRSAIAAAVQTGDPEVGTVLQGWMKDAAQPDWLRVAAAQGVYQLDPDSQAAGTVAWVVAQDAEVDIAPVIQTMLKQQLGATQLANVLGDIEVSEDQAKRILRAVYSVGRSDPPLIDVLSREAGLDKEPAELTPEMMADLVHQVTTKGDPKRGEEVFRRRDLTCFNCHAVSGAGGNIGPDLSAVGASSPADYLINAIVKPEQDVKEMYRMLKVQTIDGQLLSGVIAKEDEETVVLRDAVGEEYVIPQDDIEVAVEGGSLMPKGLKALMTSQEFVDLIAFLDELGQPGPLAVRSTQSVQRWKVAPASTFGLGMDDAAEESSGGKILELPLNEIPSLYARVAGDLPMDEVVKLTESEWAVLQAEFQVVDAGAIGLKIDGVSPRSVWVDESLWSDIAEPVEVEPGTHRLILLISPEVEAESIRVELTKPAGSTVDLTVVGGV